jgi:hypothetical protein
VALGAVGSVEALTDDLRIRRGHRTGADGAPSDLTGIINVTAETTAVEEKVATRPEGEYQSEAG